MMNFNLVLLGVKTVAREKKRAKGKKQTKKENILKGVLINETTDSAT